MPAIGAVIGKRNARIPILSTSHSAPLTNRPTVASQAPEIQSVTPDTASPIASHFPMNQSEIASQFEANR